MIMTMMKSSNTEWLGDIPAEWDVAQIGNYYELRNEKVSDYDFEPLSVTMKGIVPQLATAAKSDDHSNRKLVKKCDFVINSRSDRRGSCGISPLDGSVSLINTVMEPRGEMNPQYYNWLFHTEQFADEFYKWGHGIVDDLWTTRWQEMKKILIVAPSPDEQQAIADYLDKTCSKIDEIIAEAKASIDEYKELKQSVITQTVTMNNHTKLMETGNKILPKLPISWNLVRVKNLFFNEEKPLRVGPFGSQLTTKDYLDSGYWVYTQRSVLDNNFATNDIFISDEKYEKLKAFAVKENDILITTRGSGTPGHVAKVPRNYKKGILHPCLMRFRLDEDKCLYEYLRFVFEFSTYIREQIDSASNTTAIPVLYSDTLKNLYMPLPSIEEQKEIIEKLITFEKKIDSLITEKESLINDLEAYKKSLIYEVVTGKRRVV